MIKINFNEHLDAVFISKFNPSSIELFVDFYNGIFTKNFPNKDERASLDDNLNYFLSSNTQENMDWYTYLFIDHNNQIVAGIIYSVYSQLNAMSIQFLVVEEQRRVKHVASDILEFVKHDAQIRMNKAVEWVFIEIENPAFKEGNNMAYWYFWKKHQFKIIDFKYIQPSIGNQNPVLSLLLCVKNYRHTDIKSIECDLLKNFLLRYAKKAIMIDNPANDASIISMLSMMEKRGAKQLDLIEMDKFI